MSDVEYIEKRSVEEPPSVANAQTPESAAQNVPADRQGSGWGGWGGWSNFSSALSGAAHAVTEAIEKSDVAKTASVIGKNIKKTTIDSFDKVYEAIDPDYLREQELKREAATRNGIVPQSEDAEETQAREVPQEKDISTPALNAAKGIGSAAVEGVETVLTSIDKVFDSASSALGNTFMAGYKKIEEAKLGEKAKQTFTKVTREVQQSTVLQDGMHSGGAVVKETIGALESFGEKAFNFLGLNQLDADSDTRAPAKFRQVTIQSVFENNSGTAHLQALEMLSTESQVRVSALHPDQARSEIATIEALLTIDNIADEAAALGEYSVDSEDGAKELMKLLHDLGVENGSQVRAVTQIVSEAQIFRDEQVVVYEKEIESVAADGEPNDVTSATEEFMMTTYGEAMNSLAAIGEKSCEQILRVAEELLMRIAEERLKYSSETPKDLTASTATLSSTELAKRLRQVVIRLVAGAQLVAQRYIQTVEGVSNAFKNGHSESLASVEAIEQKVLTVKNAIHADLQYATEQVQEATGHVSPIVSLLHLTLQRSEKNEG
ncbi:uncharacterized protein SPPG_01300 [Spizellomyces punctatus DAOM BR117]|uniref:Protein FAM114A2 n=1 Tax=Spizellomyces punctatus (strain DAOM BR117) TaxID=645134 RepID=A0A0L0HSJ9_SPIPD|nr:uncharacterized protein SPPG_01300 [Spizellomyces punctatus DAOM BR117]KND03844.1 hypothetical protein SPPG_01300 [Spizellomyces punctatus DAOM BR117]|eukprot:XP_016611883.1 hypothetical protein SPPG_01300 [Spizellomyces punctatus DAOM BR117]